MTDVPGTQPPGWYYAQGDPPGTQRYWDGAQWQGGPQPVAGAGGGIGQATAATNLASPWSRLGARIVDFFILLIPVIVIGAVIGGSGQFGGGGFGFDGRAFLGSLVATAISLGYEFYFLNKEGATIGKKLLNVKVVQEDGSELVQDVVIRRLILGALAVIPFIGSLISFVVGIATAIMIFTDARRQTPNDKIAKTIVIRTN